MTAQRADTIQINEDEYIIYDLPLEQYWEVYNKPSLLSFETSMKRGYYANWIIEGYKLYIIDFYGENTILNIGQPVIIEALSMEDIFPDHYTNKVLADWYSGEITIPMGGKVDYSDVGCGTIYEYSTKIVVEKGLVVDSGVFVL